MKSLLKKDFIYHRYTVGTGPVVSENAGGNFMQ